MLNITVTSSSAKVTAFPENCTRLEYRLTIKYISKELYSYYTPRKLCLWEGILFSRCPSVRLSVRPSVTFCFLNNLKSHGWNLIKPCIHIHIYRANTYNKKIRARGHFYELFPFVILKGFSIYINRVLYIT